MYVSPVSRQHIPTSAAGGLVDDAYRQMFRIVSDLQHAVGHGRDVSQRLSRAHHLSLVRMAQAAELKEGDGGEHVVRVGQLSALLARHIGLSDEECRMICRAAPLHDIGKIAVPDSILQKPASLTEVEWQVIRLHPELGARLLYREEGRLFALAAEIALGHHEKWDGSGYPYGHREEFIPLSARIVGLVDFFDALTMDRRYRKAVPDEVVFDMVREQSGAHFDPMVARIFLEHRARFVALRNAINRRYPDLRELDLTAEHFVPFDPADPDLVASVSLRGVL